MCNFKVNPQMSLSNGILWRGTVLCHPLPDSLKKTSLKGDTNLSVKVDFLLL